MLKTAQEALEESEEQYRLLMKGAKDFAVVMLDAGDRVALWNSGAAFQFGYDVDEIVGKEFPCFFSKSDIAREWPARVLQRALDDGVAEDEGWRIRKDGSRYCATSIVTALRDPNGGLRGFSCVTHDITASKQTEAELRYLRQSNDQLFEARDLERKQIAKELLENVSQSLAAVGMYVSSMGKFKAPLSAAEQLFLDEGHRALWRYCAEIRTLSHDLYPEGLDDLGLAAAIRGLASGFKERHGINVNVRIPPDLVRLPAERELALFRVLEAVLKNVCRHSGSKTAKVHVSCNATEVSLEVRDAGRVTPLSEDVTAGGSATRTGIQELRNRMSNLGGRLEFDSGRNGTKVRAVLPFVLLQTEAAQ